MTDRDDNEDDFGLDAYNDIRAHLDLWAASSSGSNNPSPSAARFPILRETPGSAGATGGNVEHRSRRSFPTRREDGFSPSSMHFQESNEIISKSPIKCVPSGGVESPLQQENNESTSWTKETERANNHHGEITIEEPWRENFDSYRPYSETLLNYLRSREDLSRRIRHHEDSSDIMTFSGAHGSAERANDDAYTMEAERLEMQFLESLAGICLARASSGIDDSREASRNEGNFWDLLAALRSGGLSSLFYCVDGASPPELELLEDPSNLVEKSPADVLSICVWGGKEYSGGALPIQRLRAALSWIESCHSRRFEEALSNEGEDPILPPPRRLTMWPATLASLQRGGSGSGVIHPDAPIVSSFKTDSSPLHNVMFTPLLPDDEVDDARLLRACFMLFQSGRGAEAIELVKECGQPWRAAAWTGGEALASGGTGNPTRALWKQQCCLISRKIAEVIPLNASPLASSGHMKLYSSAAYEAAILSLLSDNVDCALNNPVFQTWEDRVHVIISSERGMIEDAVLRAHNQARADAVRGDTADLHLLGSESRVRNHRGNDSSISFGNNGDLETAFGSLRVSSNEQMNEESRDPFRNGMMSFLVGCGSLKAYIEDFAAYSIEMTDEDGASLLRFLTHLIVFVDSVLPVFSSSLAYPPGVASMDHDNISLREVLLLKYSSHLSSKRGLWPHVALYASLLSHKNMITTYTSFLIHVHSDLERRAALKHARDLFPEDADRIVLRNVVRRILFCSDDDCMPEPGEEPPPARVCLADMRRMNSVRWLCYYPEHGPDALVCANTLLRKFLLSSIENKLKAPENLFPAKFFVGNVLPKDLLDKAIDHCGHFHEPNLVGFSETKPGLISRPFYRNLMAEFLSIQRFLSAHTNYYQFLNIISRTSPQHNSPSIVLVDTYSKSEGKIADKMEQNAFRQKKASLCKIVIDSSHRAREALMEVLTFAGGWMFDEEISHLGAGISEDERSKRSREMLCLRTHFLPMSVRMLHEVLTKTAAWLEQMIRDALDQFEGAGQGVVLALLDSFDQAHRSNPVISVDILKTSQAAPGFWYRKALSLSGVVASDSYSLYESFSDADIEEFKNLMAETLIKLSNSVNSRTCLDY